METKIKKITAPDFTVSISSGKAKLALQNIWMPENRNPPLLVLDEKGIPAESWGSRDPRLNRQVLLTELKRGAVLLCQSGATLHRVMGRLAKLMSEQAETDALATFGKLFGLGLYLSSRGASERHRTGYEP